MLLYLQLEDYLAQWFVNDMGGANPVKLPRGCMEANILELFLTIPPEGQCCVKAPEHSVAIELPNFRSKDTRYNFYLPPRAVEALKACIRNRFDLEMWNSLHKFDALFARQDEMIYAFMEAHGIEQNETNWNAIAKRYQRKRNIYKTTTNRKNKSKKSLQHQATQNDGV